LAAARCNAASIKRVAMYLLPDILGFIDIFVLQTIITNLLLARFAWHKGVGFSDLTQKKAMRARLLSRADAAERSACIGKEKAPQWLRRRSCLRFMKEKKSDRRLRRQLAEIEGLTS
jgi:hypothetical protein